MKDLVFCGAVLHAMEQVCNRSDFFHICGPWNYVPSSPAVVATIYRYSQPGSGARRLMVDIYVRSVHEPGYGYRDEGADLEFCKDLAKALMDKCMEDSDRLQEAQMLEGYYESDPEAKQSSSPIKKAKKRKVIKVVEEDEERLL